MFLKAGPTGRRLKAGSKKFEHEISLGVAIIPPPRWKKGEYNDLVFSRVGGIIITMSGIIDFFVPKEKKFFKYMQLQVSYLDKCLKQLIKISRNNKANGRQLQKTLNYISQNNEKAETCIKEIRNALHQTFITPIDRDEIQSLCTNINRIIDSVEKITAGLYFYKIKKKDAYFLAQIEILEKSVQTIEKMFGELLNLKKNRSYIDTLRQLEKKADNIFRKAITDLFTNGHNPIEVIKQKEIYELTEEAIDDTKAVGDIFETVLINNS